jgi:hypothetical protein
MSSCTESTNFGRWSSGAAAGSSSPQCPTEIAITVDLVLGYCHQSGGTYIAVSSVSIEPVQFRRQTGDEARRRFGNLVPLTGHWRDRSVVEPIAPPLGPRHPARGHRGLRLATRYCRERHQPERRGRPAFSSVQLAHFPVCKLAWQSEDRTPCFFSGSTAGSGPPNRPGRDPR